MSGEAEARTENSQTGPSALPSADVAQSFSTVSLGGNNESPAGIMLRLMIHGARELVIIPATSAVQDVISKLEIFPNWKNYSEQPFGNSKPARKPAGCLAGARLLFTHSSIL
jgi:hypothetical protein